MHICVSMSVCDFCGFLSGEDNQTWHEIHAGFTGWGRVSRVYDAELSGLNQI